MTRRKTMFIRRHKFTVVKNPTGTGGYVLCCQTPEPKFVCVCNYADAEKQATAYLTSLGIVL